MGEPGNDVSGRTGNWLVAAGAALLALHPVLWLVRSWVSPAYDSMGGYAFLVVCAMALWSLSSPGRATSRTRHRRAVLLLLASAGIRLASRLLAINVLGALTLVVDVYALGLLARLDGRGRALSPGWLAAAFAFTLPLERVLQRLVGFPLQQISAGAACTLLRGAFDGVRCEGVRLFLNGHDVLVDLPCSGARGLLQLLFLFACLAALARPGRLLALVGMATALGAGLLSNALRIALLAVGIAYRDRFGAIDVMEPPWHGLIGLATLALAAASLVLWSRHGERAPEASSSSTESVSSATSRHVSLAAASGFLALALAILAAPARPVDVAEKTPPPDLPAYLDGDVSTPVPLTEREREYFSLFGGGASRARYGARTLMLVSTSSPLRHLHAPDECLAGSGMKVHFLGVDRNTLPTAVYRAVAPDGAAYRVAVTYVSDTGEMVPSVAEVVWRWFQSPARWSAVQRITSWESPSGAHARFDEVVALALDLDHESLERKETP